MTKYSEAIAHYNQLMELGADQNTALHDTQIAFDLEDYEADFLVDPMAYYEWPADNEEENYEAA